MDTNRRVVALAVVVALCLGGPLAAAGWERPAKWMGPGDFLSGGMGARILVWLGLAPAPDGAPKCDTCGSIDPNGCPQARIDRGGSIDPDGAASTTTTDRGMSIDPDGVH
ncbi:MAG TPA: hypothetical protein VIA62_23250 [Thermoanaerobaculia bacterium]|jgi:hypothetical protein|nr:hypothetical protein [Thermoanaerobaculia bacterium]